MPNKTRRSYQVLTIMTIVLLCGGTIFYHFIEQFSWLDSLYFCITTLATIGLGDLYPVTIAGKVFTIIYIILGVGVIGAFITTTARRSFWRTNKRHDKNIIKNDGHNTDKKKHK